MQCIHGTKVKFLILLFLVTFSQAAWLPYPSGLPSVTQSYDTILLKTWGGIKKRNIDAYSIPLVHRPKSEMPHDAVSEGVGYGMFCALYCNDQTYFNKIWDAGEQYMWATNSYNWRVDRDGKLQGEGAAADAEEDIACALIFADMLVKQKIWQPHSSPKGATYSVRAQSIIENIWTNLVENGKYVRAGNLFGGQAFVNPGYFAPAYYRIFGAYGATKHDWKGVIDQCYTTIGLSQGYKNGLVPDWMKPDGPFTDGGVGYNSYGNGQYFYKDAIRILWRCAMDYQWNGEPRAKAFLDNAYAFIKTPRQANFFKMDGSQLPAADTFTLGNGVRRFRSEHSHLTVGMWATAAIASKGIAAADSFSDELMRFYTPGADYFGKENDPAGEDTLHNEMYFDQFLAWFGASLISGIFTNVYEDLSDSNFSLPVDWKVPPTLSCVEFDANVKPLRISGVFTKSARWTVELKKQTADSSVLMSGVGETLSVAWYGLASTGAPLPAGWYDVTISARALKNPFKDSCWLGRPLDIKSGNRLVVDNFYDRDLTPFLGIKWQNYLDSYEGKSGKSTVPIFEVQGQDTAAYLCWSYLLSGGSSLGYDPYAALEWYCKSPGDSGKFASIDTIIVVAKSKSPLGVSAQLITSDITDYNFFQDSIYLNTEWKEFALPIKSFKHRFSGGSAAVDLSKLTSLRFQVQNKDNSTNEIHLKRMLLTGSLASQFKSPPQYLNRPISIKDNSPRRVSLRPVRVENRGRVGFFLPMTYKSGNILIVDAHGTTVRRLTANPGVTFWDGLDQEKSPVRSGMYFVMISGQQGKVGVKISFIAP
jgi:endo-1,4-beta-D-glucanase Y